MKKIPSAVKRQLKQLYNYNKKIQDLSSKVLDYFEENGVDLNDFEDDTDNLLVYLINGGINTIEELDEVIEKIEITFIKKINK